jgi:hypothetical protein
MRRQSSYHDDCRYEKDDMKRNIAAVFIVFLSVSLHAQWTQSAVNAEMSRLLREAQNGFVPNGCGPAGSPEAPVTILNSLESYNACVIHDRDYENLNMTREEAGRLYTVT